MNDEIQKINKGLEKTLNKHGYPFQYSVIAYANELFNKNVSPWRAPVSEFPAAVQDFDTRIDIILQYQDKPYFLIIETASCLKRSLDKLDVWISSVHMQTINKLFNPVFYFSRTVVAET